MIEDLLPCPMCGRNFPFTYISFNTAVLRCHCGVEMHKGAVTVMYKRDEIPEALKPHTYEPTCLVMKMSDGREVGYPDHGYVGVDAMAAFWHAGITKKWNSRVIKEEKTEAA